ncbi:LysR family transcriptional regulator [Roseospira marina]|uniref:LysR family transcriptional regulator n=1 Tax=Roseospira marina TaxID=140057 RepID=A0A5M6I755_9PROT|nr:LysR substrate-binding domain-containing protein [Roseospira marina]KAA5603953.1 LysR family transcriptional regulator [Roseospira marina]MBB4315920.1 DNA-binding transcriptional LysR family regulator [Roseospira marina]MBB5089118.1 DNA-binding transcriptional LysR family regulator [Roseospira marina]
MHLQSLRLLLAVDDTGSFSAAATRLNTVQSNVTAHIKKLEAELGVRLVDRKGTVRLTSAGRALADDAERLLTIHDAAVARFRGRPADSGRLRIGAMETTLALRLPPVLAAFHAAHPGVDIALQTGPTADLVADLLEGRLDGAFICDAVPGAALYQVPAFRETLVLVSRDRLTALPPAHQLLTTAFLVFRQGCGYRHRTERLLASLGVTAVRMFEFGTLDGILGCVAAGMGYAVLPRAVVEAHRLRFDIQTLPLPPDIGVVDTLFAAPEPGTWSPALTAFAGALDQGTLAPDTAVAS